MSEEAIRLPALPEPEVFRATWDGGVGWSQYHDERDPLPAEWDDGPPNEVRGFFTGEAMQEYARAAVLAERERAARVCDELARKDDTCIGDMPDLSKFGAAIRKGA